MADGEAFWVPTQSILQGSDAPLVRKPKLSENLLKKPPFRFLHDVISEVIRNTGFAKDLFDESESNSKNVKDKESKVAYLNKIIDYVAEATGTRVPVRPLKVVAGLEPELTNEFLQALGRAEDGGWQGMCDHDVIADFNSEHRTSVSWGDAGRNPRLSDRVTGS